MSTYKLYYLNGRGRGEVSRLLFAVAEQKYEDIRYERDEWLQHKSETPLGQVPVLEFNGVKLPQSISIARFLAKQFQLAGKDNFEQAKIDAIADTINDLIIAFVTVRDQSHASKREENTQKFLKEQLPKHFQNLDVLRKQYGGDGQFFVGNHMTWVDLLFFDVGESFLMLDKTCLDKYPWLKDNLEAVKIQPKISEYLKNRPETSF
ncbi:hypothetical protein I4U23_019899 [Adineta vaga]|nr:hypothetical protein I4U23_019899 [Adineta vaga]